MTADTIASPAWTSPPAGSGPPTIYDGFSISTELGQLATTDGAVTYGCALRATEAANNPDKVSFQRTLLLSHGDASLNNAWNPGTFPPMDQLSATLLRAGFGYMQTLIQAVNRGFREIKQSEALSMSEARSRTGMTEAALRVRER